MSDICETTYIENILTGTGRKVRYQSLPVYEDRKFMDRNVKKGGKIVYFKSFLEPNECPKWTEEVLNKKLEMEDCQCQKIHLSGHVIIDPSGSIVSYNPDDLFLMGFDVYDNTSFQYIEGIEIPEKLKKGYKEVFTLSQEPILGKEKYRNYLRAKQENGYEIFYFKNQPFAKKRIHLCGLTPYSVMISKEEKEHELKEILDFISNSIKKIMVVDCDKAIECYEYSYINNQVNFMNNETLFNGLRGKDTGRIQEFMKDLTTKHKQLISEAPRVKKSLESAMDPKDMFQNFSLN